MSSSITALLSAIIDYAGLFPPTKLAMAPTVNNYDAYRRDEHAWMLGRLVVPVARLDEFEQAAAPLLPTADDDDPWFITALCAAADDANSLDRDVERIHVFNEVHADAGAGLARIDAIELKADSAAAIDDALDAVPDEIAPFFEIALDADLRGMIAALAGTGGAAKARTGGVTADAIPSCEQLARFLAACAKADVPFKATAGLHHPVRAQHRLTYDADAPLGVMHGFLNVFLCAAALHARAINEQDAATMLDERDAGAFVFSDEGVSWRGVWIETERLARAREDFAASFGSCSFTEPIDDLRALRLL